MALLAVTALVLVALASCEAPLAAPAGAYRITPPAGYAAAWDQVQQCSGRRASFDRIRWHAVPDVAIPCPAGECSGVWYPPHDIYLAEIHVHDAAGAYFVARHEMLHDLLQVAEHPGAFCACGLGGTEPEMGGCSAGALTSRTRPPRPTTPLPR